MLIGRNRQYQRAHFTNEAEIERVVQTYAMDLFGPNILYLPQAKVSTIGGRGTVPDAIVIDVERQEWYIVEAERAMHGTWEHIAPQISKQLAAVAFSETRELILQLALNQISQNQQLLQIFSELGIAEIEVHGVLQRILRKAVTIAIPIDSIPKDLRDWIQTLRNDVKVWVLEKYVATDNEADVLYNLPDENLPTLATKASPGRAAPVLRTRTSEPYQELMESGLLPEGSAVVLEYGPRGQPRQTFAGTVRRDGIEVDGHVLSPSYAAVRCMNKAGSPRKTANGWIMWRTKDGTFLSDLYESVGSADGEAQIEEPSSLAESPSR